jgi:hypothetical protein
VADAGSVVGPKEIAMLHLRPTVRPQWQQRVMRRRNHTQKGPLLAQLRRTLIGYQSVRFEPLDRTTVRKVVVGLLAGCTSRPLTPPRAAFLARRAMW